MTSLAPPPEEGFDLPPGFAARRMTPAELDAVQEVEQRCYATPWPVEIFARQLETAWASIYVVYREEAPQRLLGHVVYWVVHDELHLLNVAVHPDAQRLGLGRAMMGHLFAVARARCLQYMTLEVRVTNAPARALYEGLGFRQVAYRKKYYSDNGEDAVVLALLLDEQGNPAPEEGATP